jgi:hypothetical protein
VISARGGPSSLAALEARLYRSGTQPHRLRRAPLQTDPALRSALSTLHDPSALAKLARESGDPETRRWAIARVSDPDELREIAIREVRSDVGCAAVAKLQDEPALRSVAAHATCEGVRRAAADRLESPKKDRGRRRRERRDSRAA